MSVSLESVLNNVWQHASYDYQVSVPKATRDNINQIASIVTGSTRLTGDYLAALVKRIAAERFTSKMFENPYKKFIKGTYRYGNEIEEIYVNLCNAHEYSPAVAERELYKQEIPDVATAFHPVNSKIFYKQTVNEDDISSSFTSETGMKSLIAKVVDGMYSAAERDEFYNTKAVANAYKDHYFSIHVPEPTAANANDIVTIIKTASNLLSYPNTMYNQHGVDNATPKSRQVLILRADVDALVDVNSLALAFNMEKAEFLAGSKLQIDTFGKGMEKVIGILVDDEFFQIYIKKTKFTENYNGQSDSWQYFLHRWMRYSCSPFSNAIAFTTDTVTDPTTITVNFAETPAPEQLEKGSGAQFTATVAPLGASQNGTWSITGQKSSETLITSTGYLVIGEDEQSTTITVTCTSNVKPSITGTKAVAINQA